MITYLLGVFAICTIMYDMMINTVVHVADFCGRHIKFLPLLRSIYLDCCVRQTPQLIESSILIDFSVLAVDSIDFADYNVRQLTWQTSFKL